MPFYYPVSYLMHFRFKSSHVLNISNINQPEYHGAKITESQMPRQVNRLEKQKIKTPRLSSPAFQLTKAILPQANTIHAV